MRKPSFYSVLIILFSFFTSINAYAQPAWTFDILGKEKKPEKYEEKLLPSEKTETKKFGLFRRFLQNTTSHYNFFFNANNRLNAVVERAKISNKDDYSKLLSFYSYSLENTASQKIELDSVIYKSTAGILLHDLRTSWVDNFYFLIGKSYFLKKDFDSAALTFQFINYNLFPRKKKDDDDKIVGTNTSAVAGKGSVSIADKENRSFTQKLFTRPASRNEALIWQIRTFIEQKELGDAAGIISILQNDQNLPARLQNDLHEVTSYWFFVQNMYDSAAIHLEKALSNADTKQDKSRWQFLLAQMYETTGDFKKAELYYAKASNTTTDVVMDIYARLNSAKMMRNTDNKEELNKSIAALLNMAKKDKYETFRDIIYYSAAQLTVQKTDTVNGIILYKKSVATAINPSTYKDKSFMQLGNIAFSQQSYKDAGAYYDSVTVFVKENNIDSATIATRKEVLGRLIPKIDKIEKEDSLQRIAALPQLERNDFIKKLAKKYKKENGIKEEDFGGDDPITFANDSKKPKDLFGGSESNNGQWYFYNGSQRSKGFNDFKSKWGKRVNVDNWRRQTAVNFATTTKADNGLGNNLDPDAPLSKEELAQTNKVVLDYSFEGLMAGLPLTKDKLDTSNVIWAKNLYDVAQIFQSELQDYETAIMKYNELVNKFPTDSLLPDAYVGLSFCYSKLGNTAKAELYKNLVKVNFAASNAAKMINNPAANSANKKDQAATSKYESIYGMFIEGKFDEALAAKKMADSTYGKNYWSPQLLYIESVFYIRERKDSLAISTLKNIVSLYAKSPLKPKAATLIEVLGRRAAIEKYLTELEITRVADDKVVMVDDKPIVKPTTVATVKLAEPKIVAPVIVKKIISDTIKAPAIYVNKAFVLQPDKPHFVAMVLDKVDAVYVNEAKNALERFNKESMATINIIIKKDTISADKSLLLFSNFENAEVAIKYFDKIKKVAPSELSWLQAAKYSFIIISDNNLQLLKSNKDLASYKQLLNANFGNKF